MVLNFRFRSFARWLRARSGSPRWWFLAMLLYILVTPAWFSAGELLAWGGEELDSSSSPTAFFLFTRPGLWCDAAVNVAFLVTGILMLGAVTWSGPRRAFAAGFLLFGMAYCTTSFIPAAQPLGSMLIPGILWHDHYTDFVGETTSEWEDTSDTLLAAAAEHGGTATIVSHPDEYHENVRVRISGARYITEAEFSAWCHAVSYVFLGIVGGLIAKRMYLNRYTSEVISEAHVSPVRAAEGSKHEHE